MNKHYIEQQHELSCDIFLLLERLMHKWRITTHRTETKIDCTSLIHSVKADVRVKTVGFFTSLHMLEETKLVTPWMYHLPSWPRQFSGPPESPCERSRSMMKALMMLLCISVRDKLVLSCHSHCILKQHHLPHTPSCSSQYCPPVAATTHAVLHHRQQGLLQFIRHGAMGWHTNMTKMLNLEPLAYQHRRCW